MGLIVEAGRIRERISAPPLPEEVFLSWLLAQPAGADLAAAAEIEIRKLQRYRGGHPGPRRHVALFEALQGTGGPKTRAQITQ